MLPYVASMKRVSLLIDNALVKYKRLMCAKLWNLGCLEIGGAFKMDTLVSFVRGVRALK
jgi:hypothetical protein